MLFRSASQTAFNSCLYSQGYVFYNKHADPWVQATTDSYIRAQTLEATIKKPSTVSWANTKVVCVVTNDTTGIVSLGTKGSISKEPSNLKAQFEFMTYPVENLTFENNYRPGGNIYTTDQVKEAYGQRYQKTSTWTYNLFMEPGTTTQMVLPLQDLRNSSGALTSTGGSPTEPHAYFRWYDYKTGKRSEHTADRKSVV